MYILTNTLTKETHSWPVELDAIEVKKLNYAYALNGSPWAYIEFDDSQPDDMHNFIFHQPI